MVPLACVSLGKSPCELLLRTEVSPCIKKIIVELGKHLGKGIWGLADKGLPVFYGVAFVLLVIRVLPEREFGNFVLIQEIFLVISGLAQGFALQPLLKFAAEESTENDSIVGAGFFLNIAFTLFCSVIIVVIRNPLGYVLNSTMLPPLLLYVPAMLAASLMRNFTLVLLQTRFMIKEIFWTDAVHFLGAPILVYIVSKMNRFDTALDLIVINLISLSGSSLVGMWLSRSMFSLKANTRMKEVRKLWDYGKYSLGGIASFLFTTKSDSFILSAFTGPVQVAIYNSVKVFIRVYDMTTQVIQMFIFPGVSKLSSKGDTTNLRSLVEKAILFSTIGMAPVFLVLLALSSPIIGVVYQGRYAEAIPLLRWFAILSFIVPIGAVTSNALLGLGQAKVSFTISIQSLVASLVVFLVCIPLWGLTGATVGYILSTLVFAWLSSIYTARFIPITLTGVASHTKDITHFLRSRLHRR